MKICDTLFARCGKKLEDVIKSNKGQLRKRNMYTVI